MEKGYIWQGEYGKRSHLKPLFKELLKEQDTSSLEMMAIFVNNNPYNFEFYIAMIQDIPSEKEVDLQFESMFIFSEIKVLEECGYYMRPFGKEKQVFISHSSMDKKEVEMIIPYLNRQDLPVWFDKYSIPVGTSITEQVQKGIEESDMVIFWVTDNFLKSNWCKMEMKAYIGRMIEENIRMFIVMDDEIEIKKHPLFLRDIKHLRREHRSVIEIAEEIAGIIKQM